jgi:ABC-type multidrug transport system fused ATPase/permease subunit
VIVCSLRILPAFQGIFVSITEIHTHITLFEEVYEDYNEKIKINKLTYLNDKNFNENSSNIKFDKKIFLKDVSLKIDDRIILDKINLELQTNKLVAIIGKSGSGKTSILNIIAGLLEPTTGKVVYDKNEVNYLTRLNNSSLVSQFTFLYEDTLLNNIIFDKTDPLKDKELLEKNIQLSGLETLYNKIGRRPDYLIKDSGKNFSGGEKQRIGLARAFSKDTNILLLDEFTSSLDEKKEIDIFQKILNIKKKKLIIFSSHKINLIKLADSVIGIKNGKIEFISNPQLDDQLNNKISDLYK